MTRRAGCRGLPRHSPRHSPRPLPSGVAGWVAVLILATSAWAARPAQAEWEPVGAITGSLHIDVSGLEGERRYGGALMVDLWEPIGVFRLGLAAGVGALTNGEDADNRLVAPLGLSLGLQFGTGTVGLSLTGRAGVWGGANNQGLDGGGFLSGGASLDIRVGERIDLGLGVEIWGFFDGPTRMMVSPALSIKWTP